MLTCSVTVPMWTEHKPELGLTLGSVAYRLRVPDAGYLPTPAPRLPWPPQDGTQTPPYRVAGMENQVNRCKALSGMSGLADTGEPRQSQPHPNPPRKGGLRNNAARSVRHQAGGRDRGIGAVGTRSMAMVARLQGPTRKVKA